MKKVIGIFLLIITMIATISLAAYPEDLEEQELNELEEEEILTLDDLQGEESYTGDYNYDDYDYEYDYDNYMNDQDVTDGDVYKIEDEVTIREIINGNVYIMAQNVTLDGAMIYGDVFVMAENVEMTNVEVNGSIYALTQSFNFSGMVNDIYTCAQTINFDENAYVWRDIKAVANTINLNGYIGKNANIVAQDLTIGENTTIEGNLEYNSDEEVNIPESAEIGNVIFRQTEEAGTELTNALRFTKMAYKLVTIIAKTLIVAMIIVFLVKKFDQLNRSENMAMDFVKLFGKGIGVLILVPIIGIILLCTVIGIPLGLVVLAIYALFLYIAISLVSLEIAYRILSKKEAKKGTIIGVAILIALAIWVIDLIPVLGSVVNGILFLIGLGIGYDIIFQKSKKEEINENEKGSN